MTTTTRRGFLTVAGAASLAAGTGLFQQAIARAEEAEGKPAKLTLGMASYTLRSFPRAEAIELTKQAGVDHVCFKSMHLPMDSTDEECAAAAKECADAGVKLYGAGVCYMKSPEEVENTFRYAKAAGMDTIVGVPSPELLPLVDKLVKETGIRVAIHNHGPGDKVYPSPSDIWEKTKDFDPRIGLCIDIGHTQRIGEDPAEAILKYADRLHDMHFKDVTASAPEGRCCIAGTGVIDLVAVVRALIKIGYSNVASLEFEADAKNPLPGSARSIGYIRGVEAAV